MSHMYHSTLEILSSHPKPPFIFHLQSLKLGHSSCKHKRKTIYFSKGLRCSVFCEASNLLLRLWFRYTYELVQVSVDGDAASSYFSPLVDCSTNYVSVLSGSWDFMSVYGFILEEDNLANRWNYPLFFPGDDESPSSVARESWIELGLFSDSKFDVELVRLGWSRPQSILWT